MYMYLGSHYALQILGHFTIGNGRYLLTRYVNQTANLCATDWIKQDGRRVGQNNMPMVCMWKFTVLEDQTHKTGRHFNLFENKEIKNLVRLPAKNCKKCSGS